MSRYIDADVLKINISRLHALNDEAEIRRAYELNPHSTMTDFEDTLVSVFDAIDNAPTIDAPTWIPFEIRPTDAEEREYFKSDTVLVGTLPDDGDEILVSRGKWVWQDTFVSDELGAWLDSYGEIEDGMAWMPLPEPWKGTDDGADNI